MPGGDPLRRPAGLSVFETGSDGWGSFVLVRTDGAARLAGGTGQTDDREGRSASKGASARHRQAGPASPVQNISLFSFFFCLLNITRTTGDSGRLDPRFRA